MEHPFFGEIIKRGCKEGTFLGRRGSVHYTILWKGEKFPEWVPAVAIERTRKSNMELIRSLIDHSTQHTSSLTHIRRKGGLKKGPRKVVGQTGDVRGMHDPVQDEEPKQESVA